MKTFKSYRKNQDGLFICEECKKLFKISAALSTHITFKHEKEENRTFLIDPEGFTYPRYITELI